MARTHHASTENAPGLSPTCTYKSWLRTEEQDREVMRGMSSGKCAEVHKLSRYPDRPGISNKREKKRARKGRRVRVLATLIDALLSTDGQKYSSDMGEDALRGPFPQRTKIYGTYV